MMDRQMAVQLDRWLTTPPDDDDDDEIIDYRIGWNLRAADKPLRLCLTDSQRQGYRDSRKLTALRKVMGDDAI